MTTLFRAIKFSDCGNKIIEKMINGVQKINKLMTTLFRAIMFSDAGNNIIKKTVSKKNNKL